MLDMTYHAAQANAPTNQPVQTEYGPWQGLVLAGENDRRGQVPRNWRDKDLLHEKTGLEISTRRSEAFLAQGPADSKKTKEGCVEWSRR